LLLTGGAANKAIVWKVGSGQMATSFAHAAAVNDACFSPDDRLIASAGADKTARIWQVEDGRALGSPLHHAAAVTQVSFGPDGGTLATVCDDRKVRLWQLGKADPGKANPDPARLLFTLVHGDTVNQASFSHDGQWLLTTCTDGAARMWSVATGRQRGLPLRHFSEVNRAAFSHDGSRVVTAGDDNTARIWDAATQQPLPPLLPHHGTVECAAFSPDGKWLITASKDQRVRLWNVRPERLRPVAERTVSPPAADDIPAWQKPEGLPSPDKRLLIKAIEPNSIRVVDQATGTDVGPLLKHNSDILSVSFSPDGRRVLSSSDDNTARVWDPASGELTAPPLTPRVLGELGGIQPGRQESGDGQHRPHGARLGRGQQRPAEPASLPSLRSPPRRLQPRRPLGPHHRRRQHRTPLGPPPRQPPRRRPRAARPGPRRQPHRPRPRVSAAGPGDRAG
jgi:WD40 repeat protein